jgi:hypothetical protein
VYRLFRFGDLLRPGVVQNTATHLSQPTQTNLGSFSDTHLWFADFYTTDEVGIGSFHDTFFRLSSISDTSATSSTQQVMDLMRLKFPGMPSIGVCANPVK